MGTCIFEIIFWAASLWPFITDYQNRVEANAALEAEEEAVVSPDDSSYGYETPAPADVTSGDDTPIYDEFGCD